MLSAKMAAILTRENELNGWGCGNIGFIITPLLQYTYFFLYLTLKQLFFFFSKNNFIS